MDLLSTILGAGDGAAVEQIANKLGLDKSQAASVIGALAPSLGQGLAKNTADSGGLDSLMGALQKGNHARYLDNPELSVQDSGVLEGNKILGHLLGSKEASREVASQASAQTGVSGDLIKKILPMLATLAMGALSKSNAQAPESGLDLGGLLGSLLGGGGNNNSGVGDLIGMAGKLFK